MKASDIVRNTEAHIDVAVAAGFQSDQLDLCIAGTRGLAAVCHRLSVNAGWWLDSDAKNPETFATKLCLIHSEISEAMEGGRKGLPDSHLPGRSMVEVELADAVIRIFDLAGALNLDLAGAIVDKLAYNLHRADHKLSARAADGGKKF